MLIGHINLTKEFDDQLLVLIFALAEHRVQQNVIAACPALAQRLKGRAGVTVSTCLSSPVAAYCAFRKCDIAHAHDTMAARAGLLLRLTASQRYVITHREPVRPSQDAITRSAHRRADGIVCTSANGASEMQEYCSGVPIDVVIPPPSASDCEGVGRRTAADYLKIYRRVLEQSVVPDLLI